MIRDYKEKQIRENYRMYRENCIADYGECEMPLKDYVERESESDPDFFRWLFDDGDISDFGTNLAAARREEFMDWLEELD